MAMGEGSNIERVERERGSSGMEEREVNWEGWRERENILGKESRRGPSGVKEGEFQGAERIRKVQG